MKKIELRQMGIAAIRLLCAVLSPIYYMPCIRFRNKAISGRKNLNKKLWEKDAIVHVWKKFFIIYEINMVRTWKEKIIYKRTSSGNIVAKSVNYPCVCEASNIDEIKIRMSCLIESFATDTLRMLKQYEPFEIEEGQL